MKRSCVRTAIIAAEELLRRAESGEIDSFVVIIPVDDATPDDHGVLMHSVDTQACGDLTAFDALGMMDLARQEFLNRLSSHPATRVMDHIVKMAESKEGE